MVIGNGFLWLMVHGAQVKGRRCLTPGIPLADYYGRYFDIREDFLKHYPESQAAFHPRPHLKGMLDFVGRTSLLRLGLNVVGHHHSGIDDCYSVLQLIKHLRERGPLPALTLRVPVCDPCHH